MTTQSANKSASSMAELMARHTTPVTTLHKGQEVEGIITKLTSSEILLDLQSKTEAVVLEKERRYIRSMLALLKIGDKVKVTVLNAESDTGNAVVSLRRFIDSKTWDRLAAIEKSHEKLDVTIKNTTKGGYMVETVDGIDGFLPNSHISFKQGAQDIIGKTIPVMIAELHQEGRKLIVSQKTILGQKDFDDLAKILKVGKKVSGVVSHVPTFGIFVSIQLKDKEDKEMLVDGFVHVSEISWEKVADVS